MFKDLQVQILEDVVSYQDLPEVAGEAALQALHWQGWTVNRRISFSSQAAASSLVLYVNNNPSSSYKATDVRTETGLNWHQVGVGMKALGFEARQKSVKGKKVMTYVK